MNSIKYFLAQDTVDEKDIRALIAWLKTNPRLTKGQLTLAFEEKWSRWLGRRYSVFCNSGSSANLLMYYALLLSGRLKNKKIIVPACGWVTTVAPAIQLGLEPIMCEADEDTFGLELNHLEALVRKQRPSAVIVVQVLGVPHKMKELAALQRQYRFLLLEDACAALGSTYQGKRIGTFGDLASFSLYFGHQLSTIEGGVVATDDRQFYNLLLMLRSHGWGKDLEPAFHQKLMRKHRIDNFGAPFVFYEPGFNFRNNDLGAFLGLRQLEKVDRMIERRNENHGLYKKLVGERFTVQKYSPRDAAASIHFCLLAQSSQERRIIVNALQKNGIETRLFTAGNLGRHPFWVKRYGRFRAPMADRLYETGFFLPNHPYLKKRDIHFITNVVKKI